MTINKSGKGRGISKYKRNEKLYSSYPNLNDTVDRTGLFIACSAAKFMRGILTAQNLSKNTVNCGWSHSGRSGIISNPKRTLTTTLVLVASTRNADHMPSASETAPILRGVHTMMRAVAVIEIELHVQVLFAAYQGTHRY